MRYIRRKRNKTRHKDLRLKLNSRNINNPLIREGKEEEKAQITFPSKIILYLRKNSKGSEDDKTQDFYNDLTEDGEDIRKLRTPIPDKHKTKTLSQERREEVSRPLGSESDQPSREVDLNNNSKISKFSKNSPIKKKDLKDAVNISDDILKNIPDGGKQRTSGDKKAEKYELKMVNGFAVTKPAGVNSSFENPKKEIKAGGATFKKPESSIENPPKRSQLAKPSFSLKKK